MTKQTELLSTITDNKANITIVSEANVEHNDDKKTVTRNSAFKEYNIEYKVVKNNQKARIAVVLEKEIKYSRLNNLESSNNSMIVLKIKQTNRKYFALIATYHEWKHFGEDDALTKEGINNQLKRMKEITEIVKEVKKMKIPIIWAGDINLDMNPKNDTSKRADVKVLKPMLIDCMIENNLVLINKEPTWFRIGKRESLLDLYLLSHP